MIIFKRTKFIFVENKQLNNGETFYSTYEKARASIINYIEDIGDFPGFKVDSESDQGDYDKTYDISISWDGYHNNRVRERLTITRVYVY